MLSTTKPMIPMQGFLPTLSSAAVGGQAWVDAFGTRILASQALVCPKCRDPAWHEPLAELGIPASAVWSIRALVPKRRLVQGVLLPSLNPNLTPSSDPSTTLGPLGLEAETGNSRMPCGFALSNGKAQNATHLENKNWSTTLGQRHVAKQMDVGKTL